MEFTNNKPIYRQIIEYCYLCIADGRWKVDNRIPSTKDLAIDLSVNNRTVLKAFDEMAALGVIYQKRGLGYFVAPEAEALIMADRRREFMESTLTDFIARMKFLGLTRSDILPLLPD